MSVALQRLDPKKNAVAGALFGTPKHLAKKSVKIREDGSVKCKNSNFFDVAFNFQSYGIGMKLTRARWKQPDCFWTITHIKPSLQQSTLKHGKAYGVLTWKGVTETTPRKIHSTFKREWHLYNSEYFAKYKSKQEVFRDHGDLVKADKRKFYTELRSEKSKFIAEERKKFEAQWKASREQIWQEEKEQKRVEMEKFEEDLQGEIIEDKKKKD